MQRASEKGAAVQREAAAERAELDGGLSEREDLEGLLPEGVDAEVALALLGSAGLTIEEALALYERGELESRAQELGPGELAALSELVGGTAEEESVGPALANARERTACSCGGGDKEEEDEEESGARHRPIERTARGPARWLIVADEASGLSPGQMRRSAFLARVEEVVRTTAETSLARTGRSARDCPYIERSLRYYETKDSRHIERALRRYAPAANGAASTRQYLEAVQERVQTAVDRWSRTGEVTGVPRGVPAPLAVRLHSTLAAAHRPRPLLRSADDGAVAEAHPQAIRAQLGSGRPLESSVRGRMESVFGASLSSVRVHTDARAAALSSQFQARAFAFGDDVAFAGGRYAPGTPVGDALIAHELAHVLQQRGTSQDDTSFDGHAAQDLERDSDRSAMSVAMRLWQGGRDGALELKREALPRLRSGLRLSRCKDEEKKPSPPTPKPTPVAPCKPTMKSFEAKKTGSVAMTDAWRPPVCELAFGTPSAAGVTFESEVDVPSGCTGKLEYVQLVDYCFEHRNAADSKWTFRKSSEVGLDSSDPYASKTVSGAGKVAFKSDDSPGTPATGKDRVNVKKANFNMYLLWTPDAPSGSPRVGLGVANWNWKANATKTGSSGTCTADWTVADVDASGGTGTATSAVPKWTKTYPGDASSGDGRC